MLVRRNVSRLENSYSAYRRRSHSNTRKTLPSETGESSQTPSGTFGIVVLADGASRGGGAASLSKDMITAGRVTLIGTGVRVRPGIVGAVERLNVPRPMDDSHRFPYLAGRRRVIIVFFGLATPLINDLTATSDGDLFLRHDGRFHAQGCLESHRSPLEPCHFRR